MVSAYQAVDVDAADDATVADTQLEPVDKSAEEEEKPSLLTRFAGLLYMAASAFTFSLMSLLIHVLSVKEAIPAYEQIFFRGLIGALISYGILKKQGHSVAGKPENRPLLLGRALFGFWGMMCNWMSITQLEFGEGTTIVFSAPALTMLLARVYLKEPIGGYGFVAMVLSFIGVVLIARPAFLFGGIASPPLSSFDNSTGLPEIEMMSAVVNPEVPSAVVPRNVMIVVGLMGATCSAMTNVMVRQMQAEHPLVVVFFLMAMCVVLSPLLLPIQQPKLILDIKDLIAILLIGLFGILGQFLKTRGLQLEKAGIASSMRLLDLLMAFIFQVALFSDTEPVNPLSALGAAVIVFSVLLIGYSKL